MSLITEIEDLIEYFESKSAHTQEVAAGSAMDALKKQLENMGGASKKAKAQEPKKEEPEDSSEEEDDLPKSGKKIDSTHNPDDDDDDDKDTAPVTAPVTVNTKIAQNVKLVDTSSVAEFYSKLIKLKDKLEALDKVDDEDVEDIKERAAKAYKVALKKLKELATKNFPKRLETFGKQAQEKIIEALSEEDDDGETHYHFNEEKARFSRFVKIDENDLTYSYKVILREVKDNEDFAYPVYVLIISQKIVASEDNRPRFYITRTLKDSVDYGLGKEFTNSKGMIRLLNALLSYDHIRSNIDKINIPFEDQELSERFVHEHVKSVSVDHKSHKIVIRLKSNATEQDAHALIPDFIRNLGEIVNQKKIAVKYSVSKSEPYRIEFILVQKMKSKDTINSEQLADMKERYGLSDDAYRALVKFFVVGN